MFSVGHLISYLRRVPAVGAAFLAFIRLLSTLGLIWRRRRFSGAFGENEPIPKPYGRIVPGDYLSKVEFLYPPPKGRLEQIDGETCYEIRLIWDRRFNHIRFCFSARQRDPEITRIVFVFQNDRAAYKVKEAALLAFGARSLKPVMTWPNIGGYRVIIRLNRTYEVEKRRPRPRRAKSLCTTKNVGGKEPKSHSRKPKAKKTSS